MNSHAFPYIKCINFSLLVDCFGEMNRYEKEHNVKLLIKKLFLEPFAHNELLNINLS